MSPETAASPSPQARAAAPKRLLRVSRAHEPILFAVVSLSGWVLDFLVFNALVYLAALSPFSANYVSSIVGATFAFTLFCLYSAANGYLPRPHQIAAYAVYQLASISVYSLAVNAVAAAPLTHNLLDAAGAPASAAAACAKIVVTPFNFLTNFISTKTVLRFLRPQHKMASDHAE